jgi:hypothetical protein
LRASESTEIADDRAPFQALVPEMAGIAADSRRSASISNLGRILSGFGALPKAMEVLLTVFAVVGGVAMIGAVWR